jgi:hypothetical protein
MQRVRLLERNIATSVLGEKAFVGRDVLTIEGPWKGNGVSFITVGDKEQDEVKELKDFNVFSGCQYIEDAVADSHQGVVLHLGIWERY